MRRYYQSLVEHYLKLATRYPKADNPIQQQWYDKTHEWLNNLPESDRRFVIDIFGKRGERDVRLNLNSSTHRRLDKIERDFAIKTGLI